jgi:hypothetical protein
MGCNIKENENFAIFSSSLFQKRGFFLNSQNILKFHTTYRYILKTWFSCIFKLIDYSTLYLRLIYFIFFVKMLPLSQATRCDDASLKSVNHFESQIRLDFGPKPYKARIRMQKSDDKELF